MHSKFHFEISNRDEQRCGGAFSEMPPPHLLLHVLHDLGGEVFYYDFFLYTWYHREQANRFICTYMYDQAHLILKPKEHFPQPRKHQPK